MFGITQLGFKIVYQFRFLFFDLLYICNTIPELRNTLIAVQKIRSEMYLSVIHLSIEHNLMRKAEYDGEYDQLITWIKIYSDHWISSSVIYDDIHFDERIHKYSKLFMSCFYPYLTPEGKINFERQQLIKQPE